MPKWIVFALWLVLGLVVGLVLRPVLFLGPSKFEQCVSDVSKVVDLSDPEALRKAQWACIESAHGIHWERK